MIADLKPYPESKESGLPWIGQVPIHWETRRLRHVCEMRVSNVDKHTSNAETPIRLCNYVDVYKNERIRGSIPFMSASASEDERVRFSLRRNDVVITKDSEQWNDIGVPSLVEYEARDLVCGYHLAILRPRPALLGAFLLRALQCKFIAAQFYVEANGITRYGLSHGAILGVAIPVPPPDEQDAIVLFLDWATSRLDRAIRTKRKLIALLNEQKQAMINQAVTRGLDPSVRLRPSGVEWLGEVPGTWDVIALGRRYDVQLGKMLDAKRITGSHLLPYLRNVDVQWDKVNTNDLPTIDILPAEYDRFTLRPGDMLTCEGGDVGRTAFWNGSLDVCGFQKALHRLRALRVGTDCPRFLYYVMFAASKLGIFQADGSENTIAHLTREKLRRHRFAFPPFQEQCLIADYLDTESATCDAMVSTVTRQTNFLREYRTRLIADVVTGKLDVRAAATTGEINEWWRAEPLEAEDSESPDLPELSPEDSEG